MRNPSHAPLSAEMTARASIATLPVARARRRSSRSTRKILTLDSRALERSRASRRRRGVENVTNGDRDHASRRSRSATTRTDPRVSARRARASPRVRATVRRKVDASRDRVARNPRDGRRGARRRGSHRIRRPARRPPPKPFVVDDAPYVVGSRVLVDALFDGETRAATVVARKGDGAGGETSGIGVVRGRGQRRRRRVGGGETTCEDWSRRARC